MFLIANTDKTDCIILDALAKILKDCQGCYKYSLKYNLRRPGRFKKKKKNYIIAGTWRKPI